MPNAGSAPNGWKFIAFKETPSGAENKKISAVWRLAPDPLTKAKQKNRRYNYDVPCRGGRKQIKENKNEISESPLPPVGESLLGTETRAFMLFGTERETVPSPDGIGNPAGKRLEKCPAVFRGDFSGNIRGSKREKEYPLPLGKILIYL